MWRRNALLPEFRLLDVIFDAQLLMHTGVRKIAMEAGWRFKWIFKSPAYFKTPELMRLCKAHIFSDICSEVAGYVNACDCTLASVDRVYGWFLRPVGLTVEQALLKFGWPHGARGDCDSYTTSCCVWFYWNQRFNFIVSDNWSEWPHISAYSGNLPET